MADDEKKKMTEVKTAVEPVQGQWHSHSTITLQRHEPNYEGLVFSDSKLEFEAKYNNEKHSECLHAQLVM